MGLKTAGCLGRVALTAMVLLGAMAAASAEKHALLCACADYTDVPGAPSDLDAPANDIRVLYDLLTSRFGFAPDSIRVLASPPQGDELGIPVHGRPTVQEIARNLQEWLGRAGPDDLIVFGYSGHGTALAGEPALMAVDYGSHHEVLTFTQLRHLHAALRDGNAVFIVDACHSGSTSSLLGQAAGLVTGGMSLSRFWPTDPLTRAAALPDLAAGDPLTAVPEEVDALQQRGATITACQVWEPAMDRGPELDIAGERRRAGTLTGSLILALQRGPANQTWGDVGRTARFLAVLRNLQTPSVVGGRLHTMPFSNPPTPPEGPPYYTGMLDEDRDLLVDRDFFLCPGSLATVLPDPPGADADGLQAVLLEEPEDPAHFRVQVDGEPPDRCRLVVTAQRVTLNPMRVWPAAGPRFETDEEATLQLGNGIERLPFVTPAANSYGSGVDYVARVDIYSGGPEGDTYPYLKIIAHDESTFTVPDPATYHERQPRFLTQSIDSLVGLLTFFRGVQGAAYVRNRASDFTVHLSVTRDQPMFEFSEQVEVEAKSDRDCIAVAFSVDSIGRRLLLPDAEGAVLLHLVGSEPALLHFPPDYGAVYEDHQDVCRVLIKMLAFTGRDAEQSLRAALQSMSGQDPAEDMLHVICSALDVEPADAIPCAGWSDNELFLAVGDAPEALQEPSL